MNSSSFQRQFVEFLGTAGLLAIVVGSGIMAERLSSGNNGVALLANTLATVAGLFVLITVFGAISGAHFNPVVTIVALIHGEISAADAIGYVTAQIIGAIAGTCIANLMFDLPLVFLSSRPRSGVGQWTGEFVATFGLVGVIIAMSRQQRSIPLIAAAVASWIAAAYWFTSSTSFANPAVTIARSLSDTFAGIRPNDVMPFIAAQFAGGLTAAFLFHRLIPKEKNGT